MKAAFFIVLLLQTLAACQAQGTFRNLNFELARVSAATSPATRVSASEALPFWRAFINGNAQADILYNGRETISGSEIILFAADSGLPIEGNYSIDIFSGGTGNSAISQSGTVPSTARSILFKTGLPGPGGAPTLTLNAEVVSNVLLERTQNYALYGADITRYAGTEVNLMFASIRPPGGASGFLLDSIEFSAIAVPEPNVPELLFLGLAVIFSLKEINRMSGDETVRAHDVNSTDDRG
jgi:hypothetical protein